MKTSDLEKILGRSQHKNLLELDGSALDFNKILVTGSNGSLGREFHNRISKTFNGEILETDIEGPFDYLDVTDFKNVNDTISNFNPDIIFHLAGAKHAPEGEVDTWTTLQINTTGTKNILDSLTKDCKLILTSTCKAANPEVVYGASKLIAERLVLNAKGSVARFFNVIETSGNVFEIWNNVEDDKPIQVASICERHFISIGEAIGLLIYTSLLESGRDIINSSALIKINEVAERLYPDRKKEIINPRRGDRLTEKFLSSSESIEKYLLDNTIIKVSNIHD